MKKIDSIFRLQLVNSGVRRGNCGVSPVFTGHDGALLWISMQ